MTAPRARLAFRIGLVGHRPNRLPQDAARLNQLRQTIRVIVQEARAAVAAVESGLYAGDPPILRAISPLAEGADRIFAEEALAENYELYCPLPFTQEEFEKDFLPPSALEPDSLTHFRGLLERARAGEGLGLFEMDGARSRAPQAYSAAGRIVLNQADLLIGVWDGQPSAGVGGTVDTLGEAVHYHVPVIWIDANAPDRWQMLHAMPEPGEAGTQQESPEDLRACVRHIVATETQMPLDGAADAQAFFAEAKPRLNAAFFWTLFRDLVTGGKFQPEFFVPDFEVQIKTQWPIRQDGAAPNLSPSDPSLSVSPLSDWINSQLRAHFAWADGLADYYAGAHRSSFIACYLLSALAVITALLPMAASNFGSFETGCVAAELAILGLVLLLLHMARKRHWHDRWTDYRLLAELIRQLRFLIPLGGGKPLPRVPAHLAVYGDPARSWMYWHVRAIARQTGVPSARVTPAYVHDCLDFLRRVVGDANGGQWGFHKAAQQRAQKMGARLRATALVLFWLTIGGVTLRLGMRLGHVPVPLSADRLLVLVAASLPALGAALEGIGNQGEFVRIAKRSAAMATGFALHAEAIDVLEKSAGPHLADVTPLSGKIAKAMVDEVVDWRLVFVDRPQ